MIMDWKEIQARAKGMSTAQLRYAVRDCHSAMRAGMPDSPQGDALKGAGYYADEGSVYQIELQRRTK